MYPLVQSREMRKVWVWSTNINNGLQTGSPHRWMHRRWISVVGTHFCSQTSKQSWYRHETQPRSCGVALGRSKLGDFVVWQSRRGFSNATFSTPRIQPRLRVHGGKTRTEGIPFIFGLNTRGTQRVNMGIYHPQLLCPLGGRFHTQQRLGWKQSWSLRTRGEQPIAAHCQKGVRACYKYEMLGCRLLGWLMLLVLVTEFQNKTTCKKRRLHNSKFLNLM